MAKQSEINYLKGFTPEELFLEKSKPFLRNPSDVGRYLRDMANLIEILALPKNSSILDLGCGTGMASFFLNKNGYKVVGVDINPKMIALAKERCQDQAIDCDFLVQDIEELDINKTFDAVVIYDALHHCQNYKKVLQNSYKTLKKGGKLVIAEPSFLHLFSPGAKEARKKYGVTELGFFRIGLKKTLKDAGFKAVKNYYFCGGLFGSGLFSFMKEILKILLHRLIAFPKAKILIEAIK